MAQFTRVPAARLPSSHYGNGSLAVRRPTARKVREEITHLRLHPGSRGRCKQRRSVPPKGNLPGKKLSASAAKLRLLKRLRCTLRYEKKAWDAGAHLVAGVDEVGRGSLFGAVVAAAVILDPAYRIRGLRDSKLLPAERREVLAERIREHAIAWATAAVDAARIDQINIYQCFAAGDADGGHAADTLCRLLAGRCGPH